MKILVDFKKYFLFISLKASIHVDNAFMDSFWVNSSFLRFSRTPFKSCKISLVEEQRKSLFFSLVSLLAQSSKHFSRTAQSSSWIGLSFAKSSSFCLTKSSSDFSIFSIGPCIDIIFSLAFGNPSWAWMSLVRSCFVEDSISAMSTACW